MTKIPSYRITLARPTDPLKAGAFGKQATHWSGGPFCDEIKKYHPDLPALINNARSSTDLVPYFEQWYDHHDDLLGEANLRLTEFLEENWTYLIDLINDITGNSDWNIDRINLALSSIYPSSFWGGTSTIDLYYDLHDFGRDLLHELTHLRTEDILGESWFEALLPDAREKAIFMEVITDVILARSANPQAQAARSPYPFLSNHGEDIKELYSESDFKTLAIATSLKVKHLTH